MSVPGTGPEVSVYRLPDFTHIGDPDTATQPTWRPEKNGAGSGGFTVQMDDTLYGDIQINDVVALRQDGVTVAAEVIEHIDEHTLDVDGVSRHIATYAGRLGGVFLDWMVIAPALGDRAQPVEEDAVFDWRSPRYDPADDAWESATAFMTVADAAGGDYAHQPMGDRFDLNAGANMILNEDGTDTYAPAGWYLFRRLITPTASGRHGEEVLMDDKGLHWVDGIQQLDINPNDGFVTASFKRLVLSHEAHLFTWAVLNAEDPDNPGLGLGPAALAYNLYKADLQDQPLSGGFQAVSDSSTDILYVGADPWPGMTVGQILTALITEAQDRGVAPWVTLSFDGADDSNGDPWERELGIATKTGTTVLAFLDELVASGRISRWRMRPDGVTLDVFRPGYSTRPGDVELTPAAVSPYEGQLIQLDRAIT